MKQREIKFRIWNGEQFGYWEPKIKDSGRYPKIIGELQQFTGLKDKNGKEIYEGDIVLYGENKLFHSPPPKEMKGVIVYNEWWAKFIIEDKNGSWNPKYTWNGTQNEKGGTDIILVIGNIYENPELLKKIK